MLNPIWVATILGLGGGLALTYVVASVLLPRLVANSRHMSFLVRLAYAGTVVAVLPALFLSLVVGGTLGGAWGEYVFGQIGLPSTGVAVGLALGVALVFALVLVGGAAIGVFLGRAVAFYRQWRVRT